MKRAWAWAAIVVACGGPPAATRPAPPAASATPSQARFHGELPVLESLPPGWSVVVNESAIELTDTSQSCTIHFGENMANVRTETAVMRLFVHPRAEEAELHRSEDAFRAVSSHCPRDLVLTRTPSYVVTEDVCKRAFMEDARCAARIRELEAAFSSIGPSVLFRVSPVMRGGDALDDQTVLDAVFPKHLHGPSDCRPHRTATTWVELDQLDHEMWEAGQFLPTVVQRVAGSFTAPSTHELLYLINVAYCAPSDFVNRVFAVFDAPAAGHLVSGPVKLRFAEATHDDWRFLAVVPGGAQAPHFLVGQSGPDGAIVKAMELTLNRPYAPGASFPPSESPSPALKSEWRDADPWKLVANLPAPRGDECTSFYAMEPDDAGARVRMARGPCAVP